MFVIEGFKIVLKLRNHVMSSVTTCCRERLLMLRESGAE